MLKDKFLTLSEAAQLTGYNNHHLRRLILDGKLKAQKLGHLWLVMPRDLAKLRRKPNTDKEK